MGRTRADLLADIPAVRSMIAHGMILDETFELGAFHEAMIVLETLPAAAGGSPERARAHFERAIEFSAGVRVGPYVTLAETVSIMEQDRAEFERLLAQALAIDVDAQPQQRLSNIILQRKAQMLLERADEFFLEPLPDGEDES
jgi:predicted anti-sigma-YlaC factor YlaD